MSDRSTGGTSDPLRGPSMQAQAQQHAPQAGLPGHDGHPPPANGHGPPAFGTPPPQGQPPHHAQHDLGFALPEASKVSTTRIIAIGGIIAAVLAAIFVVTYLPKRAQKATLDAETAAASTAKLRVKVVVPKTLKSDRALSLPGTITALEETVLYPRASGYIRSWKVDLGDKVNEGDLLAEIDTPEIDQQLAQARAQLAQTDASVVLAKANATFSAKNYDRYVHLVKEGVASQEDLEKQKAQSDVDAANVVVANANTQANRANIARLADLKNFAKVVAPFKGTVTARNIERGALVSEGTASPLFKITATDPVRVFIQVPQSFAPSMKQETKTKVSVREYPGRTFDGLVARTAGALDTTTRTMVTEIRVPNPKGELFTGMYATIAFDLATPHVIYEVPSTALVTDANGVRVATVTAENKVHLIPVVVERDTGASIEIASGLEGSERVIKLPTADTKEGTFVDVAAD